MTDSLSRSRERASRIEDSPEAQARVLVDRLRSAPPCEACGGSGRVLGPRALAIADSLEFTLAEAERAAPDAARVTCGSCAGTGSPRRARFELAAYCGDGAARLAIAAKPCGCPPADNFDVCASHGSFALWCRGLSRWADVGPVPGWVLVRAMNAGARVVCAHWLGEHNPKERRALGIAPIGSLEASEAWEDEPGEATHGEWAVLWVRAWGPGWPGGPHGSQWLPVLPAGAQPGRGLWSPGPDVSMVLAECARNGGGEAPVREAVSLALTRWALGDS
jgi:hypothetical protein